MAALYTLPVISTTTMTPDQYQRMLDNYASILEKTNQQLGVWSNPYGVAIGVLALLVAFAVATITVMLWRSSTEYKKLVRETLEEQKELMKQQTEQAKKQFEDLISEYQNRLKSATDQGKEKIQNTIDDLKKQRAMVGSYMGPQLVAGGVLNSIYSGVGSLVTRQKQSMICAKCGKSFEYYDDSWDPTSIYSAATSLRIGDRSVHCSHCGALNAPL